MLHRIGRRILAFTTPTILRIVQNPFQRRIVGITGIVGSYLTCCIVNHRRCIVGIVGIMGKSKHQGIYFIDWAWFASRPTTLVRKMLTNEAMLRQEPQQRIEVSRFLKASLCSLVDVTLCERRPAEAI